jgi:hypothetical protein
MRIETLVELVNYSAEYLTDGELRDRFEVWRALVST